MTDAGDAGRKGQPGDAAAVLIRRGHAWRNHHFLQRVTGGESPGSQIGETRRQVGSGEGGASREGICADGGDAGWNGNRGDLGAFLEGSLRQNGHGFPGNGRRNGERTGDGGGGAGDLDVGSVLGVHQRADLGCSGTRHQQKKGGRGLERTSGVRTCLRKITAG